VSSCVHSLNVWLVCRRCALPGEWAQGVWVRPSEQDTPADLLNRCVRRRLDTILVNQALAGHGTLARTLARQRRCLTRPSNIFVRPLTLPHQPTLPLHCIHYTLPGGTLATTRQVVLHYSPYSFPSLMGLVHWACINYTSALERLYRPRWHRPPIKASQGIRISVVQLTFKLEGTGCRAEPVTLSVDLSKTIHRQSWCINCTKTYSWRMSLSHKPASQLVLSTRYSQVVNEYSPQHYFIIVKRLAR